VICSKADDAIMRAQRYSNSRVDLMREKMLEVVPTGEAVFTCGSYARREASTGSDIDFFVVSNVKPRWYEDCVRAIGSVVGHEPAAEGAFGGVESRQSLIQNIGGDHDTNKNLTRRMLLLLEGDWLAGRNQLGEVRREILNRYIGKGMTDHQLALFLLNDIIRYYRTIAVDYEFKTVENVDRKPWGIRNVKLIFSRKLLYASGLFSVAMTADRTRASKIARLEELFGMSAIERLQRICGADRLGPTLLSYERFLAGLEKPDVRAVLTALTPDQRDNDVFRELKNEGHHFTRELLKLFEVTFDLGHPIRRAVVF
jgi:hypothetical protein